MPTNQFAIYRGCTPVVDTEYGAEEDRSPAAAVIEAIAAAANVDPVDLPPLFESIDSDALNQLFETRSERQESKALLSFQFETWNVFVRSDGRIRICDATKPTEPTPVFENGAA